MSYTNAPPSPSPTETTLLRGWAHLRAATEGLDSAKNLATAWQTFEGMREPAPDSRDYPLWLIGQLPLVARPIFEVAGTDLDISWDRVDQTNHAIATNLLAPHLENGPKHFKEISPSAVGVLRRAMVMMLGSRPHQRGDDQRLIVYPSPAYASNSGGGERPNKDNPHLKMFSAGDADHTVPVMVLDDATDRSGSLRPVRNHFERGGNLIVGLGHLILLEEDGPNMINGSTNRLSAVTRTAGKLVRDTLGGIKRHEIDFLDRTSDRVAWLADDYRKTPR